MTDVYATVGDVEARWRALTDVEATRCAALIAAARAPIRTTRPRYTQAGEATLRRVTCQMVIRAMQSGDMAGVTQSSQTVGPFSQSWSYGNPSGDLYLTKAERQSLGSGAQTAFSVAIGGEGE